MGLPKNYQKQSSQLNKRIESLNDLSYYTIKYNYRLTKTFAESQIESFDWGSHSQEWGVPTSVEDITKMTNVKKFSALNDEVAEKKITEWLDKQIENKIISEYDITSIEKGDLHDVLREKGLLPFIGKLEER